MVIGFAPNVALTPLGRADIDKVTLPLKPSVGVTVIVDEPFAFWGMVKVLGLAERLKSGVPVPSESGNWIVANMLCFWLLAMPSY